MKAIRLLACLCFLPSWVCVEHLAAADSTAFTKEVLIDKLKLYEECADRMSYDYVQKVEALSGFNEYERLGFAEIKKRNPKAEPLSNKDVEGEESVSQMFSNGITKRLISDTRIIKKENCEYISDGRQYIYYWPRINSARVFTGDAPPFLSINYVLTRQVDDNAMPHSSAPYLSRLAKISICDILSTDKFTVVCLRTVYNQQNRRYVGLRLFLNPELGFSIVKTEQFYGHMEDNKYVDTKIVTTCTLTDFRRNNLNFWMPYTITITENKIGVDDKGLEKIFPYIKRTFLVKNAYMLQGDKVTLSLPSGTLVSDDLTGSTYKVDSEFKPFQNSNP